MKRLVLAIVLLVVLVAIVQHPILAVPAILGGSAVLAWLIGASVLGALRLLRYGGRRAKRDWQHEPEVCPTCKRTPCLGHPEAFHQL